VALAALATGWRDEQLAGLARQPLPPEQGPTARRQLQQRPERRRRLGATQATHGERTLVARERTIRGTIHQQGHRGVRRGLQRDREAQREAQRARVLIAQAGDERFVATTRELQL